VVKRASVVVAMAEMVEHGLVGRRRGPALTWALKAAAIAGFLAIWGVLSALVAAYGLFNPIFLPAPWTVFGKLLELALARHLEVHLAATLRRVSIGFGVAAALAVTLGILAGRWRWLRQLLEPVVEVFRPIPPLAMLPLFIVWMGIGEVSKIAFIAYATFFPMFLTTVHGVLRVDPLLLRAAASLGASQPQQFFHVVLPAALPEILTGLRLGVALAFFVIVISEFIGAEHGLGFLINDGRNFFLVPQMLGAAVMLGLLGYLGNALLRGVERRLLRGQQRAS
jgi:ABC-type nitrate/sulfonate/bicarbonate transport system permease component